MAETYTRPMVEAHTNGKDRFLVPTRESIESERATIDLFLIITGLKVMAEHFDDRIAEGNDEHNLAQSMLLMLNELEGRLDAFLEAVTITPKEGAND